MNNRKSLNTVNICIMAIIVLSITVLSLYVGNEPIVVEIIPKYISLEKSVLLESTQNKKIQLIGVIDKRSTNVADIFYTHVHLPLHWIVEERIINTLSEAINLELEFYSLSGTSKSADYFLYGELLEIKTWVVQQYPEIVKASIRMNIILKNAKSNDIEWKNIISGLSSKVATNGKAVSQPSVINASINNMILNLLSDKSFVVKL